MEYQKDLIIDEMSLDKEWREQPSMYMKYANLAAEADAERKRAKELVESTHAELYLSYKREADEKGQKATEATINALIATSEPYKEVKEEAIQLEFKFNVLNNAVKSFEQRKSALENLVKLLIGGFYSEPRQDKVTSEKIEEQKGIALREAMRLKREARRKQNND